MKVKSVYQAEAYGTARKVQHLILSAQRKASKTGRK
jgi:hypothetical protein